MRIHAEFSKKAVVIPDDSR